MGDNFRKRKSNQPKKEAQFGVQSVFVQYELTKEQQSVCKQWATEIDELDGFLCRAFEQDYKLSGRWDERGNCYVAWLLPVGDGHINAGQILSGRGSSAFRAIRQVLFKHFNLCDGQEWSILGSAVSFELDD